MTAKIINFLEAKQKMSGVSLAKLRAKTRNVAVDFGPEVGQLNVEYKPSAYTPIVERQFKASMDGGLPLGALAALLENMLVSWDMLDDEKSTEKAPVYVPVSAEILESLGLDALNVIVETILKDMKPGER